MGLAILAITALSAVAGTASASASGFVSELSSQGGTSFLTAKPTSHLSLSKGSLLVAKCTGPSLRGQMGSSVEGLSLEQDPQGTEGDCISTGIKMGSCKFVLHPGASGQGAGTAEIGPAGCGPITLKSYCGDVSIGAQKGLTAEYLNTGTGMEAAVTVKLQGPIVFTIKNEIGCLAGTFTGSISETWELKASEDDTSAVQRGVEVTADGYTVGGGEEPAFHAEQTPAWINGEQSEAVKFSTPGVGFAACKVAHYTGEEASSSSTELSLGLEGSECSLGSIKATLSMNSCHYVLSVTSGGASYTGSANVVCSKEGDKIEFVSTGWCTLAIPAQTIATATYKQVGEGVGRSVNATLTGSGLSYTAAGSCVGGGEKTYANGSLQGGLMLRALQK
ncbi:MAG: hypothetical protein WA862_01575 [Solirubrobacterales bacterium]